MGNSLNFLDAARHYRQCGIAVLPLDLDKSPCSDLLPRINGAPSWKPIQEAIPADEDVVNWFADGRCEGIGIVCGSVSENLLALDFDDPTYYELFRDAIKVANAGLYARLATAVLVKTRKGLHMMLRCEAAVGSNSKLAYKAGLDGKRIIAVETRGEGGYVVAPPTEPYRLERGDYADLPVLAADEVQQIFAVIRSLTEVPETGAAINNGTLPAHAPGAKRPGDDYNQRADVLSVLGAHDWEIVGNSGGRTLLRRPGKADGVSATLGYGSGNNLYVFSSNAAPFDSDQAYSPFAVRALLEFGGDYAACAKACRAEGFGGDDGTGGWEPIIPLTKEVMPAFPVDIFPPAIASFVEHAAYSIQVPADLLGMMLFATASTLVAKTAEVRVKGEYSEPLNVMVCAVMPPASRKTAAHRLITKPLIDLEMQIRDAEREAVRDYENKKSILEARRQSLLKALEKNHDDDPDTSALLEEVEQALDDLDPIRPTTLWADDITPEALASKMADNGGRMAVLSAEGSIFDMIAGKYSGRPNLDVYLKGHAGDPLRVHRKAALAASDGVLTIQKPALTVGITVQPDVLSSLSSRSVLTGRGLMARYLYSYPIDLIGKRQVDTPEIPDDFIRYYEKLIKLLAKMRVDRMAEDWAPYPISLGADARSVYLAWAEEVEHRLGGDLKPIAMWGGKLTGATVRVAGLLHLLWNADEQYPWNIEISGRTVELAVQFARYCIPHSMAAHQEMHADPDIEKAQKILTWVHEKEASEFRARDLMRGFNFAKSIADLHGPLAILEDRGYIRVSHIAVGKSKGVRYEVNPEVFALPHDQAAPIAPPALPVANGVRDTRIGDNTDAEDHEAEATDTDQIGSDLDIGRMTDLDYAEEDEDYAPVFRFRDGENPFADIAM